MEALGYLASLLMGLSLGLIGGGGSILTVPILVYLFSVNPLIATSSSLFVVGATALLGAILSLRRGDVQLRTALVFAAPSFVGVFLTKSIFVPMLPEVLLSVQGFSLTKPVFIMGIFAVLMVLASFSMIQSKQRPEKTTPDAPHSAWIAIAAQGLFVGCITGLVGAGGGFLIVPALVGLVGLNMRSAIGTSLLIIAGNSLFGFGVALTRGLTVDWKMLFSILAIAWVGLSFGSFFSKKVPENKLKLGFGYFVLAMGTVILFDQIRRL